jgi:PAS domain S-box-containing protein
MALVICGGYVLYTQRKAALNQAMCAFCLLLALADFGQAFQALATHADLCRHWYQFSWIGWSLYPVFGLLVGIKLAEHDTWLRPWWSIVALFLPAIVILVRSQVTLVGAAGFIPAPDGTWLRLATHTGWDTYYMIYQYGYDIAALAIIGWWGYHSRSTRQQRQATAVLVTAFVTILLDVWHATSAAAAQWPFIYGIEHVIFAFGMSYAVTRQRFTLPSTSLAAEYITAHVRDLVLLTTRDGQIIEANPFAVQMLGWSRDMLRSRPLMSLLVEPAALSNPSEDGSPPPPSEVQLYTRDGAPIPVELQCSPLYDKYDDIVGIVVVGRDLRLTKALQHARDNLEREVEARTRELAATNATLRGQYEFLQQVLDTIPSPVAVKDALGRYTACNAAFGACYGQPGAAFIGKTLYDITTPALAAANTVYDEQVLRGDTVPPYETDLITAEGHLRRMLTHKAALHLSTGARGIVVVMVDITERRGMEEALRRSEAHFRGIIDTIQDVYFHTALDGRFEEISPSVYALTGVWPEALLGRQLQELELDQDRLTPYMAALRNQGRVDDFEFTFIHDDNRRRTGAVSAHVVTDEAGEPIGVEGLIRDITARKQHEAALRASEERYRELVQNANSAIVRWQRDGTITFYNEYVQQFFGYAPEEALGQNIRIFVPALDSAGTDLHAMMDAIAMHPDRFSYNENENIRRDGSLVWMAWTNKVILDSHGEVAEVLSIGSDITDRKRAEDALRESERQLQERNLELQQRVDEIRALMDVAPVAIWIATDPQCNTIIGNKAAGQMFEADTAENLSANVTPVRRFFRDGHELAPEQLPMQQAALDNRDVIDDEIDVELPSGRRITMLGSARPVRDVDGQVRGCIGVFADITDRKRAEDALRASEERFRRFFTESPIAISVFDAEGRIIDANPAALALYRIPSIAQISHLHLFESPTIPEPLKAVLRRGEIVRYETRLETDFYTVRDMALEIPEPIDLDVTITPLLQDGQPPQQYLIQVLDISAAKRSLEALQRSETMLARAQRIARMGSWEWHRGTEQLLWSEEMYRIYEVDPATFTPTEVQIADALTPGDRQAIQAVIDTPGVQASYTYTRELRLSTPSGEKVVRMQADVACNAGGFPEHVTGVMLDITEQHRAAETIARYQQELRALALEVNLAQEEERRRLATDLHDQISQPLVLAKLNLESARRAVADAGARTAMKGISTQLDALITLTSNLTFELSPPVLHELGLLAGVEWLADRLGTQYGVHVDVLCPHPLPPLAEETRIVLFRISQELLMNVVKHARTKQARVSLTATATAFTLDVADQGVGMTLPPPQGDKGGFGLFSIQERVRFFGGSVHIDTAPGAGTRVTVTLPLHDAPVEV